MLPLTFDEAASQVQLLNLDPSILEQAKDERGNFDPRRFETLIQDLKGQASGFGERQQAATQVAEGLEQAQEGFEAASPQLMTATRRFNLSKFAQMNLPDMGDTGGEQQEMLDTDYSEAFGNDASEWPQSGGEEVNDLFFPDAISLANTLDRWVGEAEQIGESPYSFALAKLQQGVGLDQYVEHGGDTTQSLELIKEPLSRYFNPDYSDLKGELASMIYKGLPGSMKNQLEEGESDTPAGQGEVITAPYREAKHMYDARIAEANEAIRRAAVQAAAARRAKEASAKGFNLKKYAAIKTATHGGVDNVIMWGPGEKRPDPFLRGQPVSDWHIMERNKGFGGDIDGLWTVDWETVWRGTVMDKYSRPYRDEKTGEWVGGYIQKRFEVDKWIPAANNLQLMPGERRRPYVPEYASTEARLQAMREKNDRGYGPQTDTTPPFNWKEATSRRSVKTSQRLSQEALRVLRTMSPERRQDFLEAFKDHRWGDAYYFMGDTQAGDDAEQAAIADQVFRLLKTQPDQQPAARVAQTDVTTERQLGNAAKRPGVFNLPSIQRHNEEPPKLDGSSEYENNYGDRIKDTRKKQAAYRLDPLDEGAIFDRRAQEGEATELPWDIQQEIDAELDYLETPDEDNFGLSPRDWGKQLWEEYQQNPDDFDWAYFETQPQEVQDVFRAHEYAQKMLGKAASIKSAQYEGNHNAGFSTPNMTEFSGAGAGGLPNASPEPDSSSKIDSFSPEKKSLFIKFYEDARARQDPSLKMKAGEIIGLREEAAIDQAYQTLKGGVDAQVGQGGGNPLSIAASRKKKA